jgi:mevalonate kinase
MKKTSKAIFKIELTKSGVMQTEIEGVTPELINMFANVFKENPEFINVILTALSVHSYNINEPKKPE